MNILSSENIPELLSFGHKKETQITEKMVLLKEWSHPSIEASEESKKGNVILMTFRLHNCDEKYVYRLTGDIPTGYTINCIANAKRIDSDITWFTYFYVQEELKRYLYRIYPSLEIKEIFSDQSTIDASNFVDCSHIRTSFISYFRHYFQFGLSTLLMMVLYTGISLFIFPFASLAFWLSIVILTIPLAVYRKKELTSLIKQSKLFKENIHIYKKAT